MSPEIIKSDSKQILESPQRNRLLARILMAIDRAQVINYFLCTHVTHNVVRPWTPQELKSRDPYQRFQWRQSAWNIGGDPPLPSPPLNPRYTLPFPPS
jgi:hypothetical protein